VEFSCKVPAGLKMKGLNEKYILKRSAADLVPQSILRRPKQPYRAPEASSFFEGEVARQDYVDELLSRRRIESDGLFNSSAVAKLLDKVKTGRATGVKDGMAIVGILSTQLVVDQFINHFGAGSCDVGNKSRAALVHN
jgi:asparagine synthase (glutamine-hydrolysing)